ncbi:MAG TPA: hypothetical protein VHJ58_12520 [Vicinamibacterales bacterium]|jgi:hypothetical protein|nr:hypothetical protein [Vicinamibacterales bacterium]
MRRLSDGMLLMIVGAALGPLGLNVLSQRTLSVIDPAMPVALVALGMLVGLGVEGQRAREGRLAGAAIIETALTTAAVAAGVMLIAPVWGASTRLPFWLVALVLGICAAPSAAASLHASEDSQSPARRVGDMDGLLSIALGGAALALLREQSSPIDAVPVLLQACAVSIVIVLAAWLLIRASSSETEQRVFTAALLLLLGGAADYLSLSALLSGLIGGVFLQIIGGPARDSVRRDVFHFQRPLLVLVLIVSGARLELQTPWLGLGVIYVLIRTAAKLAGGWAARRVVGPVASDNLGLSLLAPGILGLAFALNVVRAAGPDAAPILAVAAVGALGSDVIASFTGRQSGAAE